MHITIKARVFNEVYFPYLWDSTPLQIFYGGSGSGKSVFKAQQCVLGVVCEGRNYLVARNVEKHVRKSVFAEIKKQLEFFHLTPYFDINESNMVITCLTNQSQIIFCGLDNTENIKSITPKRGVFTDLWVEEATQVSRASYRELLRRLRGAAPVRKRVHLTFNPIFKTHWIFKEFFGGNEQRLVHTSDILILRTTYHDNKFLDDEDRKRMEAETDEYARNVYLLGLWGVIGGTIFTKWRTENLSAIRAEFNAYKNGLDFGFANDPSALVRTAKKDKRIFIFDGIYQPGLQNPELAKLIKPIVGDEIVRCDSSEPKSIAELGSDTDNPIYAVAVSKGPDSVLHGIQWLQGYEIIVDEKLQWLVNELSLYAWKQNALGETIPVPIDKNNHAIDALRYAWEDEMSFGGSPGILGASDDINETESVC